MSSEELSRMQSERNRLVNVFREADQGDLFTLDDLADRIHTGRRDAVAYWLGELASTRVIDQLITVISPVTQGGIQRFHDIEEIPEAIFDPFQMKEIDVDPSLIRIYFTKHQEPEHVSGGVGASA